MMLREFCVKKFMVVLIKLKVYMLLSTSCPLGPGPPCRMWSMPGTHLQTSPPGTWPSGLPPLCFVLLSDGS